MKKGKFLILERGHNENRIYAAKEGYIVENGARWFGLDRRDKTNGKGLEWVVTDLYTGLKYHSYGKRDEAQAAATSEIICEEVDRQKNKNNSLKKSFEEMEAQTKKAYEENSDQDIAKTCGMLYPDDEVWK